jgi:hypothetical protein
MADPQSHGDHPDNVHVDEFFEWSDYFAEPLPNSNDVPNLEPAPQPSSGAGLSDVMTPWEAYNGQESDFDMPRPDPDILRDFENPMFDPHMAPSQPIETRNDLSQQQVEWANPNNPSDELQELDRQIETSSSNLALRRSSRDANNYARDHRYNRKLRFPLVLFLKTTRIPVLSVPVWS